MIDIYKVGQYYLDIGWSVIPILPKTKTPAVKWGKYWDRYPTPEEVKQWLDNGWHLAVVTGDISGICIVDDDRVKHDLNEWGFTSPLIAKTQSGGKHYYFKYDRKLHSHSNAEIRVDLKAWHSYCLLPPFNNREWITKPSKENIDKLSPLPDEIARLINSDTKKDADGNHPPLVMSDFISIPEGNRNDALHKIACSVFSKYKKEEGIQILLGINQTYSPPLTQSEFDYQVQKAFDFIQSQKKANNENYEKPEKLQDVINKRLEEKSLEINCPKTGLPTLDKMTKGFVPKHTYLMSGETNVGKTSLACTFAVNVAKQGKRVLYLALEPDTNVVEYIASIVKNKRFDELDPLVDYDFGDLPIDIYRKKAIRTPEKLLKYIEQGERYDLIIIDHIGYFVSDKQNTYQEQSNLMKLLPEIADLKKSSILAIAHLRKPPANAKTRIPTMNDVSGSAAFKQDATDVWIIYKQPNADDATGTTFLNTGYLIVGKSKSGYSGPINIIFGNMKAGIREPEEFE